MKAIETKYNDHLFRSRLEARWAVFLDTFGIDWNYEMEGYVLNNGQCYLPDFYLPQFKTWAEVKPNITLTHDETVKIRYFATEKPLLMLIGLPNDDPLVLFSPVGIEYVYLYNDKGTWRFWSTNKGQPDLAGMYDEAISKAKQARF